jgi:hypothetical protein
MLEGQGGARVTSNSDDLEGLRRELKSRSRQRRWDQFWMVVGAIFLIGIIPGLYLVTINDGSKAIDEMAAKYGFCTQTPCSDAGRAKLMEAVLDRTNYTSEHQLRWCLGVDSWADVRVRRGGWLIGPMMKVGYLFCPDREE